MCFPFFMMISRYGLMISRSGSVWIACVLVWIGGMDRPVGSGYGSGCTCWLAAKCVYIYIWVNYNISLTWIKAIWDDFPYKPWFQWGRSEVVRIYPDIYIYYYILTIRYYKHIPILPSYTYTKSAKFDIAKWAI